MGLDMYLIGDDYIPQCSEKPDDAHIENGYQLRSKTFNLGYWRKHPDLHGYIVDSFADGIDDCKPIYLSAERMQQIITAIKNDELPRTEGFFFGESTNDSEQKQDAVEIFEKAIKWIEADPWRSVEYQASW